MGRREEIKAASATYKKATNEVAKKLKVTPVQTGHPSDDFFETIDLIPEKTKERAIKWYELGIKRGMANATDMILDGTFSMHNNNLEGPAIIKVRVRTRFNGEDWVHREFVIRASEIGFEN